MKFLSQLSRLVHAQPQLSEDEAAFRHRAGEIYFKHESQTIHESQNLSTKYSRPLLGKVYVWDLLHRLGECIDPTDAILFNVSQLTHSLQVTTAMEASGVSDEKMIVTGLIHDLGKILLLEGAPPEHVCCMNTPIGEYEAGCGLDNLSFQWNHDDFAFTRLKDFLPSDYSRILLFHSIRFPSVEKYLNDADRVFLDNFLKPFRKFDLHSKSLYRLPKRGLQDYKDLIFKYFPDPIEF